MSNSPIYKNRELKAYFATPLFVGNILDRNPAFVGRELILKTIYATLQKGAITAITYALTASASGSIGKTQIALEYAYRYKFNYDTILWLQIPDQLDHFQDNVQMLFPLLNLPTNIEPTLEEDLSTLKSWLYEQENWLLVIDNINDIPILDQILPARPRGHVLLTTRERAFATCAHLIELEKKLVAGQVKSPEQVTLSNFPCPEPIFTMCIISSAFFLLAALFLYLSILGGDVTTAFIAFWSSSCFGFFTLVTLADRASNPSNAAPFASLPE